MSNEKFFALLQGEGKALWFLGTLMTVKADGKATNGAFTLIEQVLPPGFATPPHIHHADEEAFYLIEGELRGFCGDNSWEARSGSFIYLPRAVKHGFEVSSSSPARLLQLTTPAGFEHFAEAMGEPAQSLELPPPGAPDIPRLLSEAARHNYEIIVPSNLDR
ncbi:MAG TPA: quercetin 2,3-dioxygenase [Chloroflexia bacterium]|nr:quercetin 2,3-dioxygenase [Chloroflexia bacterium]